MKIKIEYWNSKDGVRWRMKRSGRIIGESGEGYSSKRACKKTLDRLIRSITERNFFIDGEISVRPMGNITASRPTRTPIN